MAWKDFFSFSYDGRAIDVAARLLAYQQTTVIQALAELQEV